MKQILITLFFILALSFIASAQHVQELRRTVIKYWNGEPYAGDCFDLYSAGNDRILIEISSFDGAPEKQFTMVENGQDTWNYFFEYKLGMPNSLCKWIGHDGAVTLLDKKAYLFDFNGQPLDSTEISHPHSGESWRYRIASDENYYYLHNEGQETDSTYIHKLDTNFQIISLTAIKGICNDVVLSDAYIYSVSCLYKNNTYYSYVSKIHKNSMVKLWETEIPSTAYGYLALGEDGIYHASLKRYQKIHPQNLWHDGWKVTMLDTMGNINWTFHRPATYSYPYPSGYKEYFDWLNTIVALPGGGCLIGGSKSGVNNNDIRHEAMFAKVKDGAIVWEHRPVTGRSRRVDDMVIDENNNLYIYVRADTSTLLIKYKINDISSAGDAPGQPIQFTLQQNFPNPFNPSTTIRFSSLGDHTNLSVYDILGQKVRTLINGYLPPGIQEVEFNSDDLPSGTYFYALTSGKNHEVKKMVLLR